MTGRELVAELLKCDREALDYEVFVITTIQFGNNVRLTALNKVTRVQENLDVSNKRIYLKGWVGA